MSGRLIRVSKKRGRVSKKRGLNSQKGTKINLVILFIIRNIK